MEMQSLIIYERPNLVQPYLVMGFEGWPDAGRVSSGVAGLLMEGGKPRFPKEICEEGRIRIGETVLSPNLNPFGKHHAVGTISGVSMDNIASWKHRLHQIAGLDSKKLHTICSLYYNVILI